MIWPARTRSASARASREIWPSDLTSASKIVGTIERVLAGHRDADVDARVQLELAVAVGAVRARELLQRQRGGLDHEVVERRRGVVAGRGLELLAERDGLLHVDLEREHELRRGRLGLGHPARDRLLEPREVLDRRLAPARCRRRPTRPAFGASRSGASSAGVSSAASGSASAACLPLPAAASTSALTIRPPGPEPGQARQLDAQLARHPARDRRGLHAAVALVGLAAAAAPRCATGLGLLDLAPSRPRRARRVSSAPPPASCAGASSPASSSPACSAARPRPRRRPSRRRPRRSSRSSRRPAACRPPWPRSSATPAWSAS